MTPRNSGVVVGGPDQVPRVGDRTVHKLNKVLIPDKAPFREEAGVDDTNFYIIEAGCVFSALIQVKDVLKSEEPGIRPGKDVCNPHFPPTT